MNGNLLSYLHSLVEIERSCYEQECIMNNINSKYNSNNHNKRIENNYYSNESATNYMDLFFDSKPIFLALLGIAFEIYILHFESGFSLLWSFIISTIISVALLLTYLYVKAHDYLEKAKQKEYENNRIIREGNRQTEVIEKKLTREFYAIKNKYEETIKIRNTYYSLDIIYPKYRNYACIASILEYFQAGRCSTLGEAYNLLEADIRFNVINTKLDSIIDRLDAISANQSLLYNSINQANRNIRQMSDRINYMSTKIDSRLASIEYTNDITSRNVRFLTALETYKMLK